MDQIKDLDQIMKKIENDPIIQLIKEKIERIREKAVKTKLLSKHLLNIIYSENRT